MGQQRPETRRLHVPSSVPDKMPAVVVIRDNDLEQLFRARMVALQPQPLVYANHTPTFFDFAPP